MTTEMMTETAITDSDVAAILAGEAWASTDELAQVQWRDGLPWCTPIASSQGLHLVMGELMGDPALGDGVTVEGDVLAREGEITALREATCPQGWEPILWVGVREPAETGLSPRDLAWLAGDGGPTVWAIVIVSAIMPDDSCEDVGWAVVARPLGAQDVLAVAECACAGMACCPACSAAMGGLGEPPAAWGTWRPSGVWRPVMAAAEPAPTGEMCPCCEGEAGYLTLWEQVMG